MARLGGQHFRIDAEVQQAVLISAMLVSMVRCTDGTNAPMRPVKLSTYDRKTNWEVYKTQLSIISEANGWTEGAKHKTGESLQEYAYELERLANLVFSYSPETVREIIFLQYFVDGLKDKEVQKAVRMTDDDLKSVLLYSLIFEAANEASCRDRHSIRGARVTRNAPCESPWMKEMRGIERRNSRLDGSTSGLEET
ncbi:uncharacterized protein TNCV_1541951 [Trichonephila clavipes]|nr:uncharacterized protein TNCV_1541951 [Trichonephila clavipes]